MLCTVQAVYVHILPIWIYEISVYSNMLQIIFCKIVFLKATDALWTSAAVLNDLIVH